MQHKNLVETLYEQIVCQEIRSFAERFSSVTHFRTSIDNKENTP